VELVEDDRTHAVELGGVLHDAQEHAPGHDLEAGLGTDLCGFAGAVAHGVAGCLAEEVGDALGQREHGQGARLHQDDARGLEPGGRQQVPRHQGALAGAGLGLEADDGFGLQQGADPRKFVEDRQRKEGVGMGIAAHGGETSRFGPLVQSPRKW
jgi:hypothetical protein